MSADATSRTRIVKRTSRWSQPGHGDARPNSYPSALSTAQLAPKAILIGPQASPSATRARHHRTVTLSPPAITFYAAIKSP
jgi:hypothetical protein